MIITSSCGSHDLNMHTNYFILDNNFNYKSCIELVPKGEFLDIWRNNIGVIPAEDNNRYYVQQYYKEILSKIDVYEIYKELDNSILFSYGENNDFSIRHIIAEWFQVLLNVKVPEMKISANRIYEVARPSNIRKYLEESIRKNIDMRYYKSIQAAYLYEKGSSLYKLAKLLNNDDELSNVAVVNSCDLMCKADDIEFNYMKENFDKINSLTKNTH